MATISVVLIVKNEADNLHECLGSVEWADEIIVLDSGSNDQTVAKAKQLGAKTFVHTDWQGYGKQRQIAQSYASSDWVFMLDADEVVTDELKKEIIQLVKNDDKECVYQVPRLSWVFGRFIRHSGWYPDYVVRLYPRKKADYDDALVHEKVIVDKSMNVRDLKSDLLHYTYRDMHHYLVKSAGYGKSWADQKQANNKKSTLLQASVHAFFCFLKMYIIRMGFLDGRQGLLIALLSAHSTFIKYADLWVRGHDLRK